MRAQPEGKWQMAQDSLMHTPQGDTARVYSGSSMWACKRPSGAVYLRHPTGVVRIDDAVEREIMERITADRTSPYWVGNVDHPARITAIKIHQRDGVDGLKRFGLPTDSLWTSR